MRARTGVACCASLCPDGYLGIADTVVAGIAQPLYRETVPVGLEDSPAPRFELLKLDRYASATLQVSRGCPFNCGFCDMIVMFGRRPRCKSVGQIGRELDRLARSLARYGDRVRFVFGEGVQELNRQKAQIAAR